MIVYCEAKECAHNDEGGCKLVEIEIDMMGGCKKADLPDIVWFTTTDTDDDGK